MKSLFLKAACIAVIVSSPWVARSQYYYVVVGAFAADENASEFNGYLPAQLLDTAHMMSTKGNLLHLYVLKTSDKESAISKTLLLKKEIESSNSVLTDLPEAIGAENRIAEASVTKDAAMASAPELSTDPLGEASASSAAGAAGSPNSGMIPPKPVGKYFKFRIESPDGVAIPATVHQVDLTNERELGEYKSNTFVDLLRPGQATEPMTVVCGLFGYKEIYKNIDYANPAATDNEAYLDEQGAWVIPYKLERLEKGDVSVMYNVSFYKDAAIMRKPSQQDLDELATMMKSNPYYEITVHAYCNGRKKREIIALGDNKNYFDVAGSVTLTGTAKELTTLRAKAIRSYLVDQGIDERRINVFSWGGSDMLVSGDSPAAAMNDRIEIEITRD
jgi:outer membrane protein OmpA-like peptidoglycan-associated protein